MLELAGAGLQEQMEGEQSPLDIGLNAMAVALGEVFTAEIDLEALDRALDPGALVIDELVAA